VDLKARVLIFGENLVAEEKREPVIPVRRLLGEVFPKDQFFHGAVLHDYNIVIRIGKIPIDNRRYYHYTGYQKKVQEFSDSCGRKGEGNDEHGRIRL